MDKSKQLDYLQIAQFFLDNFNTIKDIEEIKKQFGLKIREITDELIEQNPQLLIENNQFIGQKHYDFKFLENNNYWGELSVDFIDNDLRNIRCQLFAEGFVSNGWGMGKKLQNIINLFSNSLGKAKELDYSSIGVIMPPSVKTIGWTEKETNIFITLRSSINQPKIRNYISFAMEYCLENHNLLIKK